jgi:hypothetical protein
MRNPHSWMKRASFLTERGLDMADTRRHVELKAQKRAPDQGKNMA